MPLLVVDGPAQALSLAECKAHLRVDHDDEDALITTLALAAEQHLAAPAGWLGRSIGEQTLELVAVGFADCMPLPAGPVRRIVSVSYLDGDGETQIVAADLWRLSNVDTINAALIRRPNAAWPAAACADDAVRIRYVAGYKSEGAPPPLKAAMLLLVGHWYMTREAATEKSVAVVPMAVEALCAPFRVWS